MMSGLDRLKARKAVDFARRVALARFLFWDPAGFGRPGLLCHKA